MWKASGSFWKASTNCQLLLTCWPRSHNTVDLAAGYREIIATILSPGLLGQSPCPPYFVRPRPQAHHRLGTP